MGHPFKRYCFNLAERLGMPRRELLEKHDSHELTELMAYDLTMNDEWRDSYLRQQMTDEDKNMAIKKLFGVA